MAGQSKSRSSGSLTLRTVNKEFRRKNADSVRAIDDVTLEVAPGTFVVLLGPSGCGKTTLLRCIAGLETPTGGVIELGGDVVFEAERGVNVPPNGRNLSMMFQSYALWPHMTAGDNVAYPIVSRKQASRAKAKARAHEVLEIVGLHGLENEHPGTLSGGQQQRVALARTLASDPPIVLFDEPLSNVDAQVREQLRLEIAAMQDRLGFTAVYVTHDQAEALALADLLVLMGDGKIAQAGPPAELYMRPASRYVAEFIGRANLLRGTVRRASSDALVIEVNGRELTANPASVAEGVAVEPGAEVSVVTRPEDLTIKSGRAGDGTIELSVTGVVYLGSHTDVVGVVGDETRPFRVSVAKGAVAPEVGDRINIDAPSAGIWIVGR
jgi:ABC-type Fe3+/spermidine/putrescine transport system ATPase subunit